MNRAGRPGYRCSSSVSSPALIADGHHLILDAKASIGQFSPGAAATAFSGLRNGPDKLLKPIAGLFVPAAWAVVALAWGRAAILRRDIS